jgi:hypothetical protein
MGWAVAEPAARSSARLDILFSGSWKRCQALIAEAAGVARDDAGSADHGRLRIDTSSNYALFFTTTQISAHFVWFETWVRRGTRSQKSATMTRRP